MPKAPNPAIKTDEHATRLAVLKCAARLFRIRGYAATSLRDIAAEAGMKAGSLYYHFASKEEIVTEVLNLGVRSVDEEVQRSVAALPAGSPPIKLFETAVAAHLSSLLELQDFTSANTRIFGSVPDHVRTETLKAREAYEKFWAGLLRRLAREGVLRPGVDLKLVRLFLIGAMNGTLEWYQAKGDRTVAQIADELSRTILAGILSSDASAETSKPAVGKGAGGKRKRAATPSQRS